MTFLKLKDKQQAQDVVLTASLPDATGQKQMMRFVPRRILRVFFIPITHFCGELRNVR